MNRFDAGIIQSLNHFAHKSAVADHAIALVADNMLLTGALMMSVFWWAWFRDNETEARQRRLVVSAILLAAFGLFVARGLAILLPFRLRPLWEPSLQFQVPYGVDTQTLLTWSSFPSDHAVFFFVLATAMFFLSRRLGIAAFAYVFFVVCLPRVYMGLHYPSDILVGALLGIGIACLLLNEHIRNGMSALPMRWHRRWPASFYSCLYLVTFLFGTMFDPLRAILSVAWHAAL
jgi:undecaprenyl-diphosphatase